MTNSFDCHYIYKHDFDSSCSIFEFLFSSIWIMHYCKVREEKNTTFKIHVVFFEFLCSSVLNTQYYKVLVGTSTMSKVHVEIGIFPLRNRPGVFIWTEPKFSVSSVSPVTSLVRFGSFFKNDSVFNSIID